MFQRRKFCFEGGAQLLDHVVGMVVVDAEDQGLLIAGGVEVIDQLLADDPVEVGGDQLAVEVGHLEVLIIFEGIVNQLALIAQTVYLTPFGEVDPLLAAAGDDANGRLLIHQIAVEYCFAIAVAIDRLARWPAENIDGVQRRGRGERHLDRIEMVDDATVGGDVVELVAKGHLALGLLLVENVTPVCFVDDDAVVAANRHHLIALQGALDQ